jgi:hypothetical protein
MSQSTIIGLLKQIVTNLGGNPSTITTISQDDNINLLNAIATLTAGGLGGGGSFPFFGTDNDVIDAITNRLRLKRSSLLFTEPIDHETAAINYGTALSPYDMRVYPNAAFPTTTKLWEWFPRQYNGTGIQDDLSVESFMSNGGVTHAGNGNYNAVLNLLYTGKNGLNESFSRLALEQNFGGWAEWHIETKPRGSADAIRNFSATIPRDSGYGNVDYRYQNHSFKVRNGWQDADPEFDAFGIAKGLISMATNRIVVKTMPHVGNLQELQIALDPSSYAVNFEANANGMSYPDRLCFGFNKGVRIRPTRYFYDEQTMEVHTKNGNNRGFSVYTDHAGGDKPVLNTNGRQRVGIGQVEYPNATLHVKKGVTDAAVSTPLIIEDVPTYTNNAAAVAAGLPVGGCYKKNMGDYFVSCIVG